MIALAAWILAPLPSLTPTRAEQGVTITDRNGLPLRSTRTADGSRAAWVPYDKIDIDLINAFVTTEDRRFWQHGGIDLRAIARATKDNLRARQVVSGASTITMQLARLVRPAPRSWSGKVTQLLWALRLEHHLSKQQILEQYLNRIELGQATTGVGAATALYFDTSPTDVSLAQAATIAGLAHAPSRDNPYVAPARARRRRDRVLRHMQTLGYASAGDIERARHEPLVAAPRRMPFEAPHFTTRVLAWLADSGASPNDSKVRTSLDITLQSALEAEVRHTVDVLHDRGVEQAAAVVLDNRSGEVLAWVGSPDFWSPNDGQTDMVVSPRQPGSALKPFLYGLAFDNGFTPATVLPDIPKAYATAVGSYAPRNYDRHFRGPVRAREALASSYNVPAVDLASRLGAGALLHTLHLAGFASLQHDAEYYGLGLALGNGDVTLIELANGYRAMANGGVWRPWTWRAQNEASKSRSLASLGMTNGERRVMSPMASALVLDILNDPAARIPGFGVSTPFDFPFPVAVKTGTSRHFTDNWAVGTTAGFTVAVWAGNFNGHTMQGVSGVTGAGPLLHRAIMATARYVQPGAFTTPAELGAVSLPVCRLSGLRATPECAQLTEWFAPGTEPRRTDDWERAGRVNLPIEYAEWSHQGPTPIATELALRPALDSRSAGDSTATTRTAELRMISPRDGDHYGIPAGIDARYATIPLRAGGRGADHVRWSVDGHPFTGRRWSLLAGEHIISAKTASGEMVEAHVTVDP
ncbi:MAG TPA: penicillin-binding protein 1C [Gemmatimonadaceae bacterium]